jgi:ParB family chromosome partitioning protein
MRFNLDAIEALDAPMALGEPLLLNIETIDEDPQQPRIEFDAEALRLLAVTVAERGVRQPISVRPHPDQAGRWILNYGARRLRAARLAGKHEIPAFVDKTADSFDQVIENEQRENLQPLELALFVQRQMRAGLSQAEIARRLGKTSGYLTFLGALIDAPDWLMELYRTGRCRGATELYELRNLHDKSPKAVSEWLEGRSVVSRGEVKALKVSLADRDAASSHPEAPSARLEAPAPERRTLEIAVPQRQVSAGAEAAPPVDDRPCVVLWAQLDAEEVAIDMTRVPIEDGFVYVRGTTSVVPNAVSVTRLRLLRIEAAGGPASAE